MPLFYFTPDKSGFPKFETKEALEWMMKNAGKKCWMDVRRETGVRSGTQNNALHKGFELIAKSLNESGLDMRKVLKAEIEIDWTIESVKEYLWRPVQNAMYSKKSTTELSKTEGEIEAIWDTLFRFLGEKHHVEFIPFPSYQSKVK